MRPARLRGFAFAAPWQATTAAKGKEKGHLQKQVPKNWMRQQPNLPWGDPKVLSALKSLTSVFGMRTGGSSPLSSPQWLYNPLSRDIYCMISSPYPKELTISSAAYKDFPLLGCGLPPCLKADNCIGSNSEKFVLPAVSVLVEIFVPYFRSVFVSFYLVFEIKPSTY